MVTLNSLLLFFAILLSGLIAGLLYAYSCSVTPGLSKLTNTAYLTAMQSINKEIQNPVFFFSFIGTLIILPVTAWNNFNHERSTVFYLLLAAACIYIVGVFGVTVAGNVPLNNSLANFNIPSADAAEITRQRIAFENSWNRFHLIRTVCAVLSFACAIAALVVKSLDARTMSL